MYIVKYSGPFGFIKPWTAVRDSETFSQQFLTPSIIEGIEILKQRGIKKILRHRLNYQGLCLQQEKTWSKGGFHIYKEKNIYKTNLGVINRAIMLNPNLYLAFESIEDAKRALIQTVCLCRNEDLLYPEYLEEMHFEDFNKINGFELIKSDKENGFKVGYNRFNNAQEMYGELIISGNPIRTSEFEYE